MLPGAICGETVKRKTLEHDIDDGDGFYEDKKPTSAVPPVKMKGKALRKLGDEEYY
jgi:hypothetical protein